MTRYRFVACESLVALVVGLPGGLHAQTFSVSQFSIGGEVGHDYIVAEPGSGRVFVSRETHFMVVDGDTGNVLGEIADTPGAHGVALAPNWHRGFTTNRGDSTVTMFDLETLAPIKKIPIAAGGLDGITYDESIDRVILTNHSRPVGTAVALDAKTGEITGTVQLEDDSPEGAASDGMGRLFVNNESKNTIQVIDAKKMTVLASWPIAPCDGPTGIAYDRASNRIFSGCSGTSVVVDATSGKVVATIPNGDGVDALGWDPTDKLIYIPAGRDGNVTVAHQDSPDEYSVVATVPTVRGGKTISVDPVKHVAYVFAPLYGPAPTPASGAALAPANGRGPRGPVIGTAFLVIRH
jgi:DNA-binding beta-propeller fold protein YncE